MSREEIEAKIRAILVSEFECDEAALKPEANLYQDLDLDSIDAVDLVVRLQQETGKKVDPQAFRAIRTYADLVDTVAKLLAE